MKNKIVTSLHRYIVTSLFLVCVYARADLTAIVTPGYQFPLDGSIAPSYMLLNELGMPTIQIFGTVGGSNTLAADSVTGAQLANSVPDGVTIGWNASNPRQLQVLTTGIYGACRSRPARTRCRFLLTRPSLRWRPIPSATRL